ncbi:MAG: hypothetical protein ACPGXK_14420, partial [Phycisphaerae bacterium]
TSNLRQLAESAFGINADALGVAFYRAVEDYERLSEFFKDVLPSDQAGGDLLARARELILELDEERIIDQEE